jgi:hypothetical protein
MYTFFTRMCAAVLLLAVAGVLGCNQAEEQPEEEAAEPVEETIVEEEEAVDESVAEGEEPVVPEELSPEQAAVDAAPSVSTISPMPQGPTDEFDFEQAGVVGYWPFNGSVDDASGNDNQGSMPLGVFRDEANAVRLGQGQWIEIPSSEAIAEFEELTAACWVQVHDMRSPEGEYIMGKGSHTENPLFALWCEGDPLIINGQVRGTEGGDIVVAAPPVPGDDAAEEGDAEAEPAESEDAEEAEPEEEAEENGEAEEAFTFSQGQWMHLALVSDADAVRLYVNGKEVASADAAGAINTLETDPLYFNRHDWYGGNEMSSRLDVSIDEALLFDRALSADELLLLTQDEDENDVADFWQQEAE